MNKLSSISNENTNFPKTLKRKLEEIQQKDDQQQQSEPSDSFTRRFLRIQQKEKQKTLLRAFIKSTDFFTSTLQPNTPSNDKKPHCLENSLLLTSLNDEITEEKYSHLRLKKWNVSKPIFYQCMDERQYVSLRKLKRLWQKAIQRHIDINELMRGDWVTIAVVTETVTSVSHMDVAQIQLSDLENTQIILFLTGKSLRLRSDILHGFIVAVLNPNILSSEREEGIALELNEHPKKLVILGESADLGYCNALLENGQRCRVPLDLRKSELCNWHLQQLCMKAASNRAVFNDTGNVPLPEREQEKLKKENCQNLSKGVFKIKNHPKTTVTIYLRNSEALQQCRNSQSQKTKQKQPQSANVKEVLPFEKADTITGKPFKMNRTNDGEVNFVELEDDESEDENPDMKQCSKRNDIENFQTSITNVHSSKMSIAYHCSECNKIMKVLCNIVGHHITIVDTSTTRYIKE